MIGLLLGALAILSLALTLWQWLETRCFPLHRRIADPDFAPALTLLKPLKGGDAEMQACLRSWLRQEYPGKVQILFGVSCAHEPAASIVRALLAESPGRDVELVVCPQRLGANAKASTLAQLSNRARHPIWVVSDADVHVPPDFLSSLVAPLKDPDVGLVNAFYALDPAPTLAMRWEAIGVNADFWGSVLQSLRFAPQRFALGAAFAVRQIHVEQGGGFATLTDVLADDFVLGRSVADQNVRIALCPVVATCREEPQGWAAVWRHQVRWARTIRVCSPWPYAASLASNATLWPLLWALSDPRWIVWAGAAACLGVRLATAWDSEARLILSTKHWRSLWLVPVKDLLQAALWALAFLGDRVEWRGERFRVLPNGELLPCNASALSAPCTASEGPPREDTQPTGL